MSILLIGCTQAADPQRAKDGAPTDATTKAGPVLAQVRVNRVAGSEHSGADTCTLAEVQPQALQVAGDPVYVNGQVLSASGERLLLAGFPNYIWRSTRKGPKRKPVADSLFGLVVDPDGEATVVPSPMPSHVGNPLAIPRPEGGWHVIFTELAQPIHESPVSEILGLWYGTFDGDRWSDLERLPVPENYELEYPEGASLLRSGDTLALAVIADPAGQVLLYERFGGRWSWERVTVPSDNKRYPEPVTVRHLALIPWRNGYALVAHKNDVTIDTIYQSLFLYARQPVWREQKVVDGMDPYVTAQFSVSPSPAADVVSWVSDERTVAYVGNFETGRMHAFTIDTSATRGGAGLLALTIGVSRLTDGTPIWITQPLTPDESGELRIFAATQDSAALIATIAFSHWRLQGSAATPTGIAIATAEFGRERPDRTFSSLLLRIRARCDDTSQ